MEATGEDREEDTGMGEEEEEERASEREESVELMGEDPEVAAAAAAATPEAAEAAAAEAAAVGAEEDEEVRQLVETGNMEQLANLVLNGEGHRLIGQKSDDPELQGFLNNVPAYMASFSKIT